MSAPGSAPRQPGLGVRGAEALPGAQPAGARLGPSLLAAPGEALAEGRGEARGEARGGSAQRTRRGNPAYPVQRGPLAAGAGPQRRAGQSNPVVSARVYPSLSGTRPPSSRTPGAQGPLPPAQADYQGRLSGPGAWPSGSGRRAYSSRPGGYSGGRREPVAIAFPTGGGTKVFSGYVGPGQGRQPAPPAPRPAPVSGEVEARRLARDALRAQMDRLAQLQRERERERQERQERRDRQLVQELRGLQAPQAQPARPPVAALPPRNPPGALPEAEQRAPRRASASASGSRSSRASRASQGSVTSQAGQGGQSVQGAQGAHGAAGTGAQGLPGASPVPPAPPAPPAQPAPHVIPRQPPRSQPGAPGMTGVPGLGGIPELVELQGAHGGRRPSAPAASAAPAAPAPPAAAAEGAVEAAPPSDGSLTPQQVLQRHRDSLTPYEQSEILQYQRVYYWGEGVKKPYQANGGINHGFDDQRGDYLGVLRDHVAYRFELIDVLGAGSFGKVFKARDHMTRKYVALKIIRNRRRFHRQGLVEVKLLETLRNNDPNDMNNCIRMHSSFYFRSHLCFATELLSINLYELLLKTELRGLSLGLVRKFAIQVLNAFRYAQQQRIIHADVKPENILLIDPNRSGIKVIDWGSGAFESETIYTYIQSRFYRAPEVILGLPYGMPIDIWSIGVMLVELYTGKPLFPGENEVDQLGRIVEYLGMPPREMMVKSPRRDEFFGRSPSGAGLVLLSRHRPNSQTLQRVLGEHKDFCDFILRLLAWDPARRPTPDESFKHPWITEGLREIDAGVRVLVVDPTKNTRSKSLPQNVRRAKEVPALPQVGQGAEAYAPGERRPGQGAGPASGRKSGLVPARLPELM